MRAIIVEDEQKSQAHLRGMLTLHCPSVTITGMATNVSDAYDLVRFQRPELIFLDIELGNENGFSLLEKMRDTQLYAGIIFTTAHEQYGIRAIRFSALDYLLKPIAKAELAAAVNKACGLHLTPDLRWQQVDLLLRLLNQQNGQEPTIAVPQSRSVKFLPLKLIEQIQSSKNYSIIHLSSGEKLTVAKGIYYFDKLLSGAGFLRVHQSHLVNPSLVQAFTRHHNMPHLLLGTGSEVPVSRLKLNLVKKTLF